VNSIAVSPRLADVYPSARFRGRRITRDEKMSLGRVQLDAVMAAVMDRDHFGWFVGNHARSASWTAAQFGRLDASPEGGTWVVVPHSRLLACELFGAWPHTVHVADRPTSTNSAWRSRKVWFAIPEDLNHLLPLAQSLTPGVAGVIILDPPCNMFKTRGGTDDWGRVHTNDRPQHVVNFRAALGKNGWQPPLLLLTEQRAMARSPLVVAKAFCLDTFWFVAGDSFGCWDEPAEQD
jgi:hypothetical protein